MPDVSKPDDPDSAATYAPQEPTPNEVNALVGDETAEADRSHSGDDPSPSATTSSPRRLARKRLRRQRRRHLWIAVMLGMVLAFIAIWNRGLMMSKRERQPLAILPGIQFENMCSEVANRQTDKLHVTDFEINDAMIPRVQELDSLETLIIDRGRLTDRSINTISALPKLRHLRLRLSPITDEGLRTLAQCETLWYINLPHANCTAEGVRALAQLPRLRQLRLGG
ncbi:MAG: hypothetical protein MI861_03540, partial [Pirellulales bacterium]|nr:hypothetical protein [Pirellulales bacterium]